MATPFDFFSTDGARPGVFSQRHLAVNRSTGYAVQAMIYRDYGVGAAHIAVWMPRTDSFLPVLLNLVTTRWFVDAVLSDAFSIHVSYRGFKGEHLVARDSLPFSNQIVIYSDTEITEQDFQTVTSTAQQAGLVVSFRGPEYARLRAEGEKPLGFLSHDSRDKDSARELVAWLSERGVGIWFDEYSIPIGASIVDSVEKGLHDCSKALLLVTPNYLANKSWAKGEMNAILNREISSGVERLVPVWRSVSRDAVAERSLVLADRRALIWDGDIEKIGPQLYKALTGKQPPIERVILEKLIADRLVK